MFHGVPSSPEHPAQPGDPEIMIGLYVDDFVYFSVSDTVESQFKDILSSHIKVSFMGVVNWFLGTHFIWRTHPDGHLSVHLSQVAFSQHLVERHHQQDVNENSSYSLPIWASY